MNPTYPQQYSQIATTDPQCDRTTEISQWLGNLESVAKDQSATIEALEKRLSYVIRPGLPVPLDTNKQAPEQMLVPLADQLRNLVRSVDRNTNTIRDLLGRCEL